MEYWNRTEQNNMLLLFKSSSYPSVNKPPFLSFFSFFLCSLASPSLNGLTQTKSSPHFFRFSLVFFDCCCRLSYQIHFTHGNIMNTSSHCFHFPIYININLAIIFWSQGEKYGESEAPDQKDWKHNKQASHFLKEKEWTYQESLWTFCSLWSWYRSHHVFSIW